MKARRGPAGQPAGRSPRRGRPALTRRPGTRGPGARDLVAVREELDQRLARAQPARWNADPDEVRKSVARLVLTLVEFLRQLMERQALRRMEARTLTAAEVEAVGQALMRLEETVRELARQFDRAPEDLGLDLGPLGRLM